MGKRSLLIWLEIAAADELAWEAVATKEVTGTVGVGNGRGVEISPPTRTGMSCVTPETTVVTVEMTG